MVVWWYAFVFSGRRGRRPLQGNLKFGRRGELRSPAFVCGFRLFSGGCKQTPLRYVANLLRKNRPSPTGWSFVRDMRLFSRVAREVDPYKVILNLVVGAIHTSPVFSNTYHRIKPLYVILSEGRRARPPTEVELFLSEERGKSKAPKRRRDLV